MSIEQDPLFLVFLDLPKSYNTLDHGRILHTLEGYGTGLKMWGILVRFWVNQKVVARQNSYHGPQIRATRGTAQGGLAPPTLLIVTVDSVVCHCISLTV